MGMLIGGMVAQIIMAFILPFIPLLLLFFKWARPFIVAYLLFLLAQWLVGQFIVATYAICGIAWLVTLVLVAHVYKLTSRGPIGAALNRLPGNWKLRIMDILDLITDKEALQERQARMTKSEIIDNVAVAQAIKRKLIGQDRVIDAFTAQIRASMFEEDRKQPVSTLFFAGPPGTGKTMAAEQLAEALGRKCIIFPMGDYRDYQMATALFGVSGGFKDSDKAGALIAALRDHKDAVMLFDEVEKADKSIYNRFLTAFQSGFIMDPSGGGLKKLHVNQAIFVFTSNSKADEIEQASIDYKDDEDARREVFTNLLVEDGFLREFCDRFDGIFAFERLQGLDVARVTALGIQRRVKNYGLDLVAGKQGIDADILFGFMERATKRGISNREVERKLRKALADGCISAKLGGYKTVRLDQGPDDSIIVVPVGQ